MWIYGTISDSIIDIVLKKNATARELWLSIESLFRDNKEARALQLENELRTMVIGDLSVHEYCQKMKTTADILANIDAHVFERALVSHLLNGLSDKFDSIINVVQHKVPFPTLLEARSLLQMEETRLSNNRNQLLATMTLLLLQRFSTPDLTAIHETPTTTSTTLDVVKKDAIVVVVDFEEEAGPLKIGNNNRRIPTPHHGTTNNHLRAILPSTHIRRILRTLHTSRSTSHALATHATMEF